MRYHTLTLELVRSECDIILFNKPNFNGLKIIFLQERTDQKLPLDCSDDHNGQPIILLHLGNTPKSVNLIPKKFDPLRLNVYDVQLENCSLLTIFPETCRHMNISLAGGGTLTRDEGDFRDLHVLLVPCYVPPKEGEIKVGGENNGVGVGEDINPAADNLDQDVSPATGVDTRSDGKSTTMTAETENINDVNEAEDKKNRATVSEDVNTAADNLDQNVSLETENVNDVNEEDKKNHATVSEDVNTAADNLDQNVSSETEDVNVVDEEDEKNHAAVSNDVKTAADSLDHNASSTTGVNTGSDVKGTMSTTKTENINDVNEEDEKNRVKASIDAKQATNVDEFFEKGLKKGVESGTKYVEGVI